MTDQIPMLAISDGPAAFLIPTLTYLSGMNITYMEDEDWTEAQVEENVRTRGCIAMLVMHPDDFHDGVLHCGPRVSKAMSVCAEIGKIWFFLVPLEADLLMQMEGKLRVCLHGGLVYHHPDAKIVTSDVRMALVLLSLPEVRNAS